MTRPAPLTHVAFIPDGNRRWARQHGIGSEKKIYEQGSEEGYEIIKAAFACGIPYVTFWASSYANLRSRPKALVGAIEKLYVQKFHELAKHPLIHDHQVKLEVCGEWREMLKPATIKAIEQAIESTAHYNQRHLTILVGYDGQRELGAATKTLLSRPQITPEDLAAASTLLRQATWTGRLPDVDLIIRTGAWQDPHNSAGFLSLLGAEAQLAFPEVLWPDFNPDIFEKIIQEYTTRERRLGK